MRILVILLVLIFGIPFLLITDLFPLHRYGMFASISMQQGGIEKFQIQTKVAGSWQPLSAGNAYLDQNYFPLQAELAFRNPSYRPELADKIRASLRTKPDSVFIIRRVASSADIQLLIYPKQ
jgi:hypothetical protein